MTIRPQPINPGSYSLGGAEFRGHSGRLFSARAAAQGNEFPIEVYINGAGLRSMVDLSIDEAEAMAGCLIAAVRMRRDADAKRKEAERKMASACFKDADGILEAA